jgi:hypothetical protein
MTWDDIGFPLGAKAQILCASNGTAEAVPFHNPIYGNRF